MTDDVHLSVERSGIVRFPVHERDGALLIAARAFEAVPFEMREVYYVTNLAGAKERGGHAHKTRDQIIIAANGSFDLVLYDGKQKQTVRMSDPSIGVRLRPGLWHEMKGFSDSCVMLVLADGVYHEADYVRSQTEFEELSRDGLWG